MREAPSWRRRRGGNCASVDASASSDRIEPAAEREQCGAKREEVRQRRPEQSRHQRPLVASVAPLAIQSRVCDARYTPAASATVTM